MKILIVMDQFDSANNGTTISAQRFAAALKELGHEVRVVAGGPGGEDVYGLPVVRFLPIAEHIIRSQGMQFARPKRATLKEAIGWADVVHFMMPFPASRAGLKIAREMGVPHTAGFHVQPENITSTLHLGRSTWANELLYTRFRDDFYNNFDHVHCPSEFIAGQLRQRGYTAKLHVISNGVASLFHPIDIPRNPILGDKLMITMVGRLSEEKRQDVLIEAVRRSRYADRIQLVLAGHGPKFNTLQRMGSTLPNPPVFGFYSTKNLRDLLCMSDLYVHSADVEIEAIACLEAVACGLVPVIADSPLSATPQFALDERSLFEAGNPQALADKIDWWLDHPEERRRMAAEYARSANVYRLGNSIRKAEEMFYEAIRDQRR